MVRAPLERLLPLSPFSQDAEKLCSQQSPNKQITRQPGELHLCLHLHLYVPTFYRKQPKGKTNLEKMLHLGAFVISLLSLYRNCWLGYDAQTLLTLHDQRAASPFFFSLTGLICASLMIDVASRENCPPAVRS